MKKRGEKSMRLRLKAIAEDEASKEFQAIVKFRDIDGKYRSLSLPLSELEDIKALKKTLRNRGCHFSNDQDKTETALTNLANSTKDAERWKFAAGTGWYDGHRQFVHPDGVIGKLRGHTLIKPPGTYARNHNSALQVRGSHEKWVEGVATPAQYSSRMILGICTSLAAPLLDFADLNCFGILVHGRDLREQPKVRDVILAGLMDYIARARRDGRVLLNGELEVVARGKPFIGIKRPKGFRQMARKSCFRNAAILATLAERAQYVEGFAGSKDWPIHHAWVTLDGVHAIDVTWDDATENEYFGIVFETHEVRKVLFERRLWTPMLGDGWRYRGKRKETRSASMTATRKIPLRLIAPLACKRPEIVGRYVAMLRAGQKPPPVALITQERGARYKYRISDGAHRVRAARRVGLKTIEARIIVTFG